MYSYSKIKGLEEYPGSKDQIVKKLLNLIPPHQVYVEPFLGGGSIMRYKLPARMNIGNDLNSDVIQRWKADERFQEEYIFTCGSAIDCIHNHRFLGDRNLPGGGVFFYLDPPYPMGSRSWQEDLYIHEMSDEDHVELLSVVRSISCNCMISSYRNKIYDTMLEHWNTVTFQTRTHRYTATEIVYFNYEVPKKLHDYRYIGDDYHERQRIKRKIRRWTKKLISMESRERHAIIEAVKSYEGA